MLRVMAQRQAWAPFIFIFAGCTVISPDIHRPVAAHALPAIESVDLEAFALEAALRDTLRDALKAYSVVAEISSDSPLRIEGTVRDTKAASSSGQIAWNVINSATLMVLLGGPYVGASEATVEIHVYQNRKPLRTYIGKGRANWRTSYEVGARVPEARKRSKERAIRLAIWDAVAQMAEDPPEREPSPPDYK